MKLQEILERIKLSHPTQTDQNLVKLLNMASDDFCRKTEVIDSSFTITSVSEQRYYALLKNIVRIDSVDVDGETADKLVGRPHKRDLS
tara:strand:- start:4290 stop:4553 length:264 start_codon:yes stop_codon:yes gene_type:complete